MYGGTPILDTSSSLFAFAKMPGRGATQMLFYHSASGSAGYGIYQDDSNILRGLFGGVTIFGAATATSDFRVFELRLDSYAPRGTLLVDDVSYGTTDFFYGGGGHHGIALGADGYGANRAELDICEFVYFDHVLDATARSNLRDYFGTNYISVNAGSFPLTNQAWG
jgi:hypothetical protein